MGATFSARIAGTNHNKGKLKMWVFLNNSFVSIVEPNEVRPRGALCATLLVRARLKGDIERAFGADVKVQLTRDADYRFRALLPRTRVAFALAGMVGSIDYCNFKSSIAAKDKARSLAYMRVWTEMERLQQEQALKGKKKPKGISYLGMLQK